MSKTLLLADDSVVIQKLVGLSFANEDVEIIATDNGDDAITRAREVNPDVVLADVVMPGKSGYEVCEAIKQDPDLAHVPVLLLTGTFEAFDEARAAAVGANGQITKPFEAQSLVERVHAVMREAAAGPPVIDVNSDIQSGETEASPTTAASPATSGVGIGSFGAASAASLASETKASDEAPSYGRRVTDTEANTAGLDTSDSDFFDNQRTPQLNADELDDDFAAEFDAGDDNDDREADVLLNSPGLETSQDLAADFSDSPLAAYVGASSASRATSPAADADFDDQAEARISLPPVSPARAARPASAPASAPPSAYGAAAEASVKAAKAAVEDNLIEDDGLGLDDALPLPDVLGSPPPADLDLVSNFDSETDTAADSQGRIPDATILVGQNDINASTSPSLAIPIDDTDESHDEPIADVIASSESGSDLLEAVTVHAPSARIDRDAAVAQSPADPGANRGTPLAPTSGVADLDASLNRETRDALHIGRPGSTGSDSFSVPAADVLPRETDPLHFGPKSVGGEDLDFAFDVSEQREVTAAEALSEDAAIETDNISESQLIGTDTSELEAAAASDDEDPLVGDYDVSSSDLATAVSDIPEPDFDISEAASADTSRGLRGEQSDENDTSFSNPLVSPFSSGHYAVGLDSAPSHDDDEENRDDSGSLPAFAPEPMRTGDDEGVELASHPADDRRVSDLSPLMEQRIQETLEKVAWEAFSDLSETIVKQVISRVEQVAWDVIPEMAETLVREEIRRMKGEED